MSSVIVRIAPLLLALTLGVINGYGQHNGIVSSDPFFGTVSISTSKDELTDYPDSALMIIEVFYDDDTRMDYYRLNVSSDSYRPGRIRDTISRPYPWRMEKRIVPSGVYSVSVNQGELNACYDWVVCRNIHVEKGSVVKVRFHLPPTRKYEDGMPRPKSTLVQSKLHLQRLIPKSATGQTRSSLTVRVRDSLHVSYPFGAVLKTTRGSGPSLTGRTILINDTLTTLTIDPGEVRLSIDSRFRASAELQLPQCFDLSPGDSAMVDVTLGGAFLIDSIDLTDGYQRRRLFYGTTSVRHEPVHIESTRDSGILQLEVVDAATQLPIKSAYARISEDHFYREWIVTGGLSSFTIPTGVYDVTCDPTSSEGCWFVTREGVLVLPSHRTIVRYEMNMKQSSP